MSSYGKCMVSPINLPQYGKMQQKSWYGESQGNWYSYFSHSMDAFFPSDSLPMVYFSIGKCMRFLNNFPQYGKVQQNAWYGESLGIDTHTFFIVWVLFSHSIPILWYTSLYEKCMGFSMNFPQYAKMQQNPWYGESLWNWYSYFFHSIGAFFPSDSHPMVYFIIWEMHGFPHQFLIVRENATKLTVWDETGKLVLILFP